MRNCKGSTASQTGKVYCDNRSRPLVRFTFIQIMCDFCLNFEYVRQVADASLLPLFATDMSLNIKDPYGCEANETAQLSSADPNIRTSIQHFSILSLE